MIKLENYIKYKTYIYNILSVSSLILLGIITISLVNPETSITYAVENSGNPENSEDNNSGITLFANTATPSASLTISNSGDNTILANPESGTVYSTHSITMSSVNISNYTLSISAPAELKSVSGKTTLYGANGSTGSSMANNTWGYSYDKTGSISDTGSLTYSSFTSSTQNLESGTAPTTSSRNLILAAKFGDDAEAGHYTGTVNLLLTATPKILTTFSVSYNCNSGTGCPSNYSESSYDDGITYTIPSTAPTRSGYNFLGYNTTNSSTADSSYAPGKTITLTKASNTRTLYAVWQQSTYNYRVTYNCNSGSGCPTNLNTTSTSTSYSYTIPSTTPTRSGYTFLGYNTSNTTTASSTYAPGKTISLTSSSPTRTLYAIWQLTPGIKSITNMQDMNSPLCTNSSVGDSTTLTDVRDSSTYTVAKLSDGKCWMTQNLRLINADPLAATSNTDNNAALPNPGLWAMPSSASLYQRTSGAYYGNYTVFGAYYSWYTATARSTGVGSADAIYDICPKNWRLPTKDEYNTLISKGSVKVGPWTENSTTSGYWLGTSAVNIGAGAFFPAAGYVHNSALLSVGSGGGNYWTSTADGSESAYRLDFSSGSIEVNSRYRYRGFSIRCIAK